METKITPEESQEMIRNAVLFFRNEVDQDKVAYPPLCPGGDVAVEDCKPEWDKIPGKFDI